MNHKLTTEDFAFPSKSEQTHIHGLTKREYFAAKALIGLIQYEDERIQYTELAAAAVTLADALIEALNK